LKPDRPTRQQKETAVPFANFKVPAGTLSTEQKELIVHRTTDLYAEIYGEQARPNTMVLVEEVADGGWGIGDHVLTLAGLSDPGPGNRLRPPPG
jgi:4-oxalocrotonate tautomerase